MKNKTRAVFLTWDEWYKLACNYYEEHGNLLIPDDYKVYAEFLRKNVEFINGIYTLGNWIRTQRKAYKNSICDNDNIPYKHLAPLSADKIKRLENIGMSWDETKNQTIKMIKYNKITKEKNWLEMYKKALKYYTIFGSINIPKSIDKECGEWIKTQRKRYKLRHENAFSQRAQLNSIEVLRLELYGIIWNFDENRKNVKDFCHAWGINYNKVKHMSYNELLWRVKYLSNNGYNIEDNKEFFYMNDKEMYESYGCTRLDLLKTVVKPSEKKYKVKSLRKAL